MKNKTKNKKKLNLNKTKKNNLCNNSLISFEKDLEKSNKNLFANNNYKNELIKIFKTPYAPSKITAQSDFYTFINYRWIDETSQIIKKIQHYYTQIDSFRVVQEKVYEELIDITDEHIKNDKSKQTTQMKNFYDSLKSLDDKSAEKQVLINVNLIDELLKEGNLLKFLAEMNKNEIVSWGSPIFWSISPDQKNVSIYKSVISPPQISIYDYNIYLEDNTDDVNTKKYKKLFKHNYFNFINTMFNLTLGKNHNLKAEDVWDIELIILNTGICNSVKNDSEDGYNKVYSSDSLKKYDFDWPLFTKYLGFSKTPDYFICSNLSYLKCIINILNKDWQNSAWRTYYLYIYLRQIMRFHKGWRKIYYEFWGKFIYGEPIQFPSKLYPVFGMSVAYNYFFRTEYYKRHYNEKIINYVTNMATDLITVFKRIINRNKWLSPSTKKFALLKLKYMKLIVGEAEEKMKDPDLQYSNKDTWENLLKVAHWRTEKFIEFENESSVAFPIIDWNTMKLISKQNYVVNAFYTPTENSIYIPMAYLQKPFIDLDERGIEYNLAHMGYTLGHEMSHSLDDLGSQYDYKGNLKNWWTKRDRKIFNEKVKNVIKQYEQFASYDGIKMDASLSTGENLADISGLAICSEYLRDFQFKNKDEASIVSLSYKAFFTYFAYQNRQKVYDKAIKAQLKTNPHPLDKYRTNCPLARLEIFDSLYNIKKGDKMYWSSKDTIW